MNIQFNFIQKTGAWLGCLLLGPNAGQSQTAFAGMHQAQEHAGANLAVTDLASQLGHNALLLLIGALALLGIVFAGYISKACLDLSQRQKFTDKSFLLIGGLGLGCCVLLGSCTAAAQARFEDYRAAPAAEQRTCPMDHHIDDPSNRTYQRYPFNSYSDWHGPVYCKRCGQRINANR